MKSRRIFSFATRHSEDDGPFFDDCCCFVFVRLGASSPSSCAAFRMRMGPLTVAWDGLSTTVFLCKMTHSPRAAIAYATLRVLAMTACLSLLSIRFQSRIFRGTSLGQSDDRHRAAPGDPRAPSPARLPAASQARVSVLLLLLLLLLLPSLQQSPSSWR